MEKDENVARKRPKRHGMHGKREAYTCFSQAGLHVDRSFRESEARGPRSEIALSAKEYLESRRRNVGNTLLT